MRSLIQSTAVLLASLALSTASAGDKPKTDPDREQAFAKLSQFVGGIWTNDNPKFVIEFRYEWVLNKSAIRGLGTIDKGGEKETHVEATLGWDPAKKSVYYLDFHGGGQVYFGSLKIKGDEFHYDFESIVGAPGKYRSVGKLSASDVYEFTILAKKDGNWEPAHTIKLSRKKS